MEIQEIFYLLVVGVFAGMIMVFALSEKEDAFDKSINGLLFFGGLSLVFALSGLALEIRLIPVKAVISFIVIGIPAFSAGTLMKAYSLFQKTRGR